MQSFERSIKFYQSVDKTVFQTEEEVLAREDELLKQFKRDMDFRRIVLVGEKWWLRKSDLVASDAPTAFGCFEVLEVHKCKLKLKSIDTDEIFEHWFGNWHNDYLHQIFNSIHKWRADNF